MREIAKDTQSKILKEQFIPDHVFLYVAKGAITFFDGNKSYALKAGDGYMARKNRLAKFIVLESGENFEPILFCFEEAFLKEFQAKHSTQFSDFKQEDSFIKVRTSELIDHFIQSLKPYMKGVMELDEAFEKLKYEELLLILLRNQPELAGLFFDFRIPHKIDLEAFMNTNFKYNVSIPRFAFLTGRSLSAFKRDFKELFDETPSHWLIKKRLQEAHFLMNRKNKKPSEIYLDLGFETLSHFSFTYKKHFGVTPTEQMTQNR